MILLKHCVRPAPCASHMPGRSCRVWNVLSACPLPRRQAHHAFFAICCPPLSTPFLMCCTYSKAFETCCPPLPRVRVHTHIISPQAHEVMFGTFCPPSTPSAQSIILHLELVVRHGVLTPQAHDVAFGTFCPPSTPPPVQRSRLHFELFAHHA